MQAVDLAPQAAPQRAVYFSNLAAVSLQLLDYQPAVEQCNAALAVQPSYIKALVRRATALEKLDNPEQALADANKVRQAGSRAAWSAGPHVDACGAARGGRCCDTASAWGMQGARRG